MEEKANLRERLRDGSPEVRRRAIAEIADLDLDEGLPFVAAGLADEDWRVRKEAAAVAASLAEDARVTGMLVDAMLREDDIGLRNAAAEALVIAGPEAMDGLVERLPGMNAAGRKMATEVIGATGDPRGAEILLGLLEDPDPNVRACAAEWLGEQGGEEAVAALRAVLLRDDRLLRIVALQSLNRLGAAVPWAVLEPLLEDRIYAEQLTLAMGRSGAPQAAAVIAGGLMEDPAAARALELLHEASPEAGGAVENVLFASDEAAIDYLIRLAEDGEPAERQAAARCLLWARRPERIEAIADLARNDSLYPVLLDELKRWGEPAIAALERCMKGLAGKQLASVIGILARLLDEAAGRHRAPEFAAFLASEDVAVATSAAGAVARFGDETVVPRLLELVASPHLRVQRVSGYALCEVGRRHKERVRRQLRDLDLAGARGVQLCRVLEVVGGPEDVPRLSAALSSPEPDLRRAVPSALAAIAGAGAVETIALAMTDEDIGVRMASAEALGRVGPAAADTIVSALHLAGGPLQAALVRALGRAGHPDAPEILRSLCRGPADVALAALEAMQHLGLEMADAQDEILFHSDGEVVKQALGAFGDRVSHQQAIRLLGHPAWDVRLAVVDLLSGKADVPEVTEALGNRLVEEKDDLVRTSIARALAAGREGR